MDPRLNTWVFGRNQNALHSGQLNQAPAYPLIQGGIGGVYPSMYQFAFPSGHKDETRDDKKKIKDSDTPVLPLLKSVASTSALSQHGKGKSDGDNMDDKLLTSNLLVPNPKDKSAKDKSAKDKSVKDKNSEKDLNSVELSNFDDLQMTPETFQKKLEENLKRPFKTKTVEKKSPPKKKKKSSFLMVT
jgi:hypothetical protein